METIKKSTLLFLSDLGKNNNKEWFNKNRPRYDEARKNFELFVQDLINGASGFDPILKGLEAKNCIFRIYRDTRFSNDKSVYKTNMGGFIVRGGKKNGGRFAGYYIHIEPGQCFVAGGAYMPPAPWLNAIREKIGENGDTLNRIIQNKEFRKYFDGIDGERLKTAPKGFPKDHEHIELLKYKSFTVFRNVKDEQVISPDFYNYTLQAFKAMKPFNDFLSDY
jgi:uncharacterized protein (TIGR02453 family)